MRISFFLICKLVVLVLFSRLSFSLESDIFRDEWGESQHQEEIEIGKDEVFQLIEAVDISSTIVQFFELQIAGKTFFGVDSLTPQEVKALGAAIANNNTLTSLQISDTCLQGGVSQSFFASLKRNKSLRTIWLFRDDLGELEVGDIATFLAGNKNMMSLDLSFNSIGDEGVNNLITGLKRNRKLEDLNLGWCGIGDKGAHYLADYLKGAAALLMSLKLCANEIRIAGALDLLSILKVNARLTKLHFIRNPIIYSDIVFDEKLKEERSVCY